MAATLKDVAELAGVSTSAVSRAFTPGASVSAKMRKRVDDAANALGYSPNVLARSLTTRRTKMIGLVSNNFHNPIFLEVFDLFTRGLQARDLRPLLVNLTDETDPEKWVRLMRQYSVDGVIVASSTLSHDFAKAFQDAGIPVVHSFGRYTHAPKVHVVGIDNVACGRMAARTLIERGYTRLGFLGGPKQATSTQDRLAGFQAEIKNHSHVKMTYSYATEYSFDAGRLEMARLLKGKPQEAYFCGDDILSIGSMTAIRNVGLDVPKDIGIIGLNDMEMASWENIQLTTIHQPVQQIINASIELIIAMLDDPDRGPEYRLFLCDVIERATLKQLD